MKRKIATLLAVALVALLAMPSLALALPADNHSYTTVAKSKEGASKDALQGTSPLGSTTDSARPYVDADGDGLCDYCGTDNCGFPGTRGTGGFIDNDGDGICDNYAEGNCRYLSRSAGVCAYVDANGDGICDNYGAHGCYHAYSSQNGGQGAGAGTSGNPGLNSTPDEQGYGYGQGLGQGYGQGRGCGYCYSY